MNTQSQRFPSVGVVLLIAAVALPIVSFGKALQVKVLMSAGFSAAYRELLPEFERKTGIRVITTSGQSVGNNPNAIAAQLRRGILADVVILSREGLTELIEEERIVTGTVTDLAEVSLGVAVRAGTPKPDCLASAAFRPLRKLV